MTARQHESFGPRQAASETSQHDQSPRSPTQINVSPQIAGCGCFALSAAALLAGSVMLLVLVWGFLIPDWRTNNKYLPNSGEVLDKRLAAHTFDRDVRGRKVGTHELYRPEIKIRYEVNSRAFEVWAYDGSSMYSDRDTQQAVLDSFEVGAIYPCWYDPEHPDKVVLERGTSLGAYLFLIVPVGFLTIGAVGCYIAWKLTRMQPNPVDAGDGRVRMEMRTCPWCDSQIHVPASPWGGQVVCTTCGSNL